MIEQNDTRPRTIVQVHAFLSQWVQGAAPGITVSPDPPAAGPGTGVSLYLLEVLQDPPPRGTKRPPLQVLLRYLVTPWGPDQAAIHDTLHRLIFAALSGGQFEVEGTPMPAALWQSFGLSPRPSFILRIPLRLEQLEPSLPRVRVSKVSTIPALTSFYGRLLVPNAGPNGESMSLAAARVSIPGQDQTAISAANGYFSFDHVMPSVDGNYHLSIDVKGSIFEQTVRESGSPAAPVTIEVPLSLTDLPGRLLDQAGAPLSGVRVEWPGRQEFAPVHSDGSFTFYGVPAGLDPGRLQASSGENALNVQFKAGVLNITWGHQGIPTQPIVLHLSPSMGGS